MCGIIGAVAQRNVTPVLLEGLRRLEYRGYDSCGVAFIQKGELKRARSTTRVTELLAQADDLHANIGISHTRWATHGKPSTVNAHPHFSGDRIAIVHNGIIENYESIRTELKSLGYEFTSQTDTEVIVHLIDSLYATPHYAGNILAAVQAAVKRLRGAYALAVIAKAEPNRLIGARAGSPLVVGLGERQGETQENKAAAQENFLASDAMAIAGTTSQIIYLEEGDVVDLSIAAVTIYNAADEVQAAVDRPTHTVFAHTGMAELGDYRHFMQKEIFEQPRAIADTLEGVEGFSPSLFGEGAEAIFAQTQRILILACGTSYYAGMVAQHWLESVAGIACTLEIASEFRYRTPVAVSNTLVLTISQSGETADTLAALRYAAALGMGNSLCVCNVGTSAMVRESKLKYLTRAGPEIGVASTKAFTTQLAGLALLALTLAKQRGRLDAAREAKELEALRHVPQALYAILALEPQIIAWAQAFAKKDNALFLGRGLHYPIALEGALKLKEISYIHAEAYPAGELKHGPLALVDENMPVVVVAPNDALFEKLASNMHEVQARGGVLYVFADADSRVVADEFTHVLRLPEHYGMMSPLLHTIPMQLLAYHTACMKGTDVDKPRNLAKSVTVE